MIGGAKGIGIGIDFGIPNQYCRATSKPYIEKDVLDSLRVVASAYGKSNNDADRSIVKNLVDASNPFVISNAAYEGMSGYNGYPIILSGTNRTYQDKASYVNVVGDDKNVINLTRISFNTAAIFSHVKQNGALTSYNKDIESFKIKVTGIDYSRFFIKYSYISEANATAKTTMTIASDSIYELPKSFTSDGSLTSNDVWIGFSFTKQSGDIPDVIEDVNVTIEVISEYTGALVTDGVNDLITSTKTVQEMLGGSNKITVVSMIHQVKDSDNNVSFTNYIRGSANGYFRNIVNNYDKTGIYGYTSSDLMGLSVVNNILGDKNDYTSNGDNRDSIINGNFSVQGYSYNDGNNTGDFRSVAWYWTVIANKVLTTDQINQVIAYFNLDRTLNPDILCNTIKQGITNENHAEFSDKLIDFSGNGRDIQLNNIAWKGDSGIGKYNFSNINIIASNRFEGAVTTNKCHFTKKLTNTTNNFCDLVVISPNEPIKFKVSGLSDGRKLFVANKSGSGSNYNFDNGEHEVSLSFSEGVGQNNPFGVTGDIGDIDVTVEFIPSHAGALCLDGVNDFGKVTGMPVYKDYTIIADYERFYLELITGGRASILSKSSKVGDGFFIFNLEDQDGGKACYTFGEANGNISDDITRIIRYQSKYYNTKALSIGTAKDNDFMVLGKVREVDNRYFYGAIYSLMSFPYSMSKFLIERQLKKHKLGTFYPNMVEFRPVIKANANYKITCYQIDSTNTWKSIKVGDHIVIGAKLVFQITFDNDASELKEVVSPQLSDIIVEKRPSNPGYNIYSYITSKSPQKINLVISSYLTMLNNETLISNETLIKNE